MLWGAAAAAAGRRWGRPRVAGCCPQEAGEGWRPVAAGMVLAAAGRVVVAAGRVAVAAGQVAVAA